MKNITRESKNDFIWETHGIHVGTGRDHVKHGIDEIESAVKQAISLGHPNITFIIHSQRLTRYRYFSEKNSDVKFIRGDKAYFDYPERIERLDEKYSKKINIKYGIELEWMGTDLGLQWSRSKIFQARDADFVIGSLHFSGEGIPYDGSKGEAEMLLKLRGGAENYWAGYIEEMIEMVDLSWDMIQIVGHIDLPKLHVPLPEPLRNLDSSSHLLARRMHTLLEMISDDNLALDVNLAGIKRGCGIYPDKMILRRAKQLGIPVAVGTDSHSLDCLGQNYREGIDYLQKAGYRHYVSFSKRIPEKRPLVNVERDAEKYRILNLGIEMLNRRFSGKKQRGVPKFSFGGTFNLLLENFQNSVSIGDHEMIRLRKEERSIALSSIPPAKPSANVKGIFSYHFDKPGVLSVLLNALASEGINIETAFLNSNSDGTANAYLTVTGDNEMVYEAIEFVKGTESDQFIAVEFKENLEFPEYKKNRDYLLEVDGVELPIAVSRQMILTIHNDGPGVLLILLSALAAHCVNVNDLQLGVRGGKGYAVLSVDGNEKSVDEILTKLGPQYYEASHLILSSFDEVVKSH